MKPANIPFTSISQQIVEPESVKSDIKLENIDIVEPESIKSKKIQNDQKWDLPDFIDQMNRVKEEIEIEETDLNKDTGNIGTHSAISMEDMETIKREIKLEEPLKLEDIKNEV